MILSPSRFVSSFKLARLLQLLLLLFLVLVSSFLLSSLLLLLFLCLVVMSCRFDNQSLILKPFTFGCCCCSSSSFTFWQFKFKLSTLSKWVLSLLLLLCARFQLPNNSKLKARVLVSTWNFQRSASIQCKTHCACAKAPPGVQKANSANQMQIAESLATSSANQCRHSQMIGWNLPTTVQCWQVVEEREKSVLVGWQKDLMQIDSQRCFVSVSVSFSLLSFTYLSFQTYRSGSSPRSTAKTLWPAWRRAYSSRSSWRAFQWATCCCVSWRLQQTRF